MKRSICMASPVLMGIVSGTYDIYGSDARIFADNNNPLYQ